MVKPVKVAFLLVAAVVATVVAAPAQAAAPWHQAAGGPPGRFGAAMAYDPGAGRTVLVGGCSAYTTTQVTVHTKDDPSTLVYDERRAVPIAGYQWCAPGDALADVWVRDSTGTWSAATVAGPAPYARYGASLAYDSVAHRLTLFGGLYQTDTAVGRPAGPSAADADPCIEADVHYGIQGTESVHDDGTGQDHTYYCFHDTWQLAQSGTAWSWVRLDPTVTPPSRFQGGMASDAAGRPVVVGGCHSLGMVGAHGSATVPTYFDCAEYAAVEATAGARCLPQVPQLHVDSPLCGTAEYSTIDSWRLTWSGDPLAGGTPTWAQVGCLAPSSPESPPCGPTPARGLELAADPATGTLFYWGGYYYEPNSSYNSYQGASWSFDGTWHLLLRAGNHDQWCPSLSAFMAYGASTPVFVGGRWQVLRTGGVGKYMSTRPAGCTDDRPLDVRAWDETWLWDSASCLPAPSGDRMCWHSAGSGTPGTRLASSIAYDPVAGQVVVFGGLPGLADTWVYP